MTAKRFTTRNGVFYTDTKTGYEFQCYGEVADMMNELAEENQHLKGALKELKEISDYQAMRIKELDDDMTGKRFINDIDIGQLIDTKGELSTIDYSDKVDFYELWEFLNKLNDENEQLRQQVQKIHKLINSKIQSARELGSVRTVVALKNLQRELHGDVE